MSVSSITEMRQYLTFKLADEIFGVDVAKVREILELTTITRMPQMPEYVSGVINLRGSVVPVIDLKLKLGMVATARTVNTCIVLVEVRREEETIVLGALADSVQEVYELEPENIEPAPNNGSGINTDFIQGMGKHIQQFMMILDIDRLFADDVQEVATEEAA